MGINTTATSARGELLRMKTFLAIPLLAAGFLFTGCEATVVDRRPVVEHRYGYYERRPVYYDERRSYSDASYHSDRPVATASYSRARAPYHADVNYRHETVVNRTNVNRTTINRTNVTNSRYQAPAKKKSKKNDTRVRVDVQG